MNPRRLVIIGDSAFAQIAFHYFSDSNEYRVVGFSVERDFLQTRELFSLPVVAFDQLPDIFPAGNHSIFVAIAYGQLNRLRARLVYEASNMGYTLASYVSPYAHVSKQAKLGKHCFVFENNVIQPYCEIGNDVILWSGNHIGHHAKIGDHCFVSSHVVISGYTSVGQYCFLGVNSTVANNVTIGDDCWIGPAVLITKDTKSGSLFSAPDPVPSVVDTHKFFKVCAVPK